MNLSLIKIWLLAIRPKTLIAAVAPVMIGTAMAFGDGLHHWMTAGITLFVALIIQIGTNLANDYYDYKKGADQNNRVGPTRITQAGLVPPGIVKLSFILAFFISTIPCVYLVLRGGWPIALIEILAILSGFFYTAGKHPLGYRGWGEIFVLISFGPIAVGGTYYLQGLEINPAVILAGFGPGLLSVAILVVNNLRDIETDRLAGKRTLAVRFGRTFAHTEYLFCVIAACLTPVLVYWVTRDYICSLIAVITLLLAIPTIRAVLTQNGVLLNKSLSATARLLFIYSVLFSVGWIGWIR